MVFEVGDRVMLQVPRRAFGHAHMTLQRGTVAEVMEGAERPRYRIRWDDRRETVYGGSDLRPERPSKAG